MGTFVFEMSKDKNDTALPPFLVVVEIKNVLAQNLMRVLGGGELRQVAGMSGGMQTSDNTDDNISLRS